MIYETTKTIAITWCAQDVIDCAEDYYETKLSEDDAWYILKELYENHDCNNGLTWGHIQAAIDEFIDTETNHKWNDGRNTQ